MKALADPYEALGQALAEASQQSKAIRAQMDEFTTSVSAFPPAMLKLRLQLIACQIMVGVLSLYVQNDSKGHVFVMMGRNGVGLRWVKNEEIIEDKAWYRARGSIILSVEEVVGMCDEMANELALGKWTDAVNWINRWASWFALDSTKLR